MTKRSALRPALLLALAGLLGACDMIPFSGGKLEGTVTPPPAVWPLLPDVIQLETNPAEPYSVKLWAIGQGPVVYLHAGANRATWVENMEADPGVRLLVDTALYELTAERVTEQAEFDAFSAMYEAKYGNAPRNPSVTEAYLFRLTSR